MSMQTITRRSFVGLIGATAVSAALGTVEAFASESRQANAASDFEFVESDGYIIITGYVGQAEEVVIPRSINGNLVIAIWDEAFYKKTALFSIELPKGMTYIGDRAFAGCVSLETVVLPQRLFHIGESAFEGCTFLEEIDLPESMTELGDRAFANTYLSRATIPDGVVYVAENAFPKNCQLKRSNGSDVVLYTPFSELVVYTGGIAGYNGNSANLRIYPVTADNTEITAILNGAFKNNKTLKTIIIPENVRKIGASAFEGCTSLEKINLPGKLVSLGNRAFAGSGLVDISLPGTLTQLGDYVFAQTKLTEAVVPVTVGYVSEGTFPEECRIIYSDGSEIVLYTPFSQLILNGDGIADYTGSIVDLRIYPETPDGVSITKILSGAFRNNDKLRSVILPQGLREIETSAFKGCISLKEITLPNSLGTIGRFAFDGCTSLNEVVIPDSVKNISSGIFPSTCRLLRANGEVIVIKLIQPCGTDSQTGLSMITFGQYQQTNNSFELIQWLVLEEREDGTALLLSKYALDCKRYNNKYEDTTWADCGLRTWLNNQFLNSAFSAEEQQLIKTTHLENKSNPEYGTKGGVATDDQVFLLSYDEIKRYFGAAPRDTEEKLIAYPTQYAKSQGVSTDNSGACVWWLRSPGSSSSDAALVLSNGYVYSLGWGVNYSDYGVRPALVVNLKS